MFARSKLQLIIFTATALGCKGSFIVSAENTQEQRTGSETEPTPSPSSDPTSTPTPTPTSAALNLTPPENFTDGDHGNSLADSPTLSWDAVDGAASYEIAIGTSQGATDMLDWTNVGNVTSVAKGSLTLPNADILYASVRAVGSDVSKSDVSTGDGWQVLVCPTNWVKVYGNTTSGLGGSVYVNGTQTRYDGSSRSLSDFCVMKYEMKLHTGASIEVSGDTYAGGFDVDYMNPGAVNAVSDPTGSPWARIRRKNGSAALDAERACSNIGGTGLVAAGVDGHFYLINNSQWQAIARDIESVPSNWNDASAGAEADDYLNKGNVDGSAYGCDAAILYVSDNSCASPDPGSPHIKKRTHTLSNGEEIWDIAGNASEWILDDPDPVNDASNDGYASTNTYTSLNPFDDEEGPAGANKLMWGPLGNHAAKNSVLYGGLGHFSEAGGWGSYLRGGGWGGSESGVFSSFATGVTGDWYSWGARCVWAP